MSTWDLLGQGANLLFSPEPMLMLLLGMVVGLVFGGLPGFSSGNTAALMLPLTLGMSTGGAIIFLGGIYCGAQYGGGVPAILIGTPGTTGAIATVFDGYAMAKQGRADEALGISLMSSVIGGVIASIIAIFLIRPIASVALEFGPAEMALLAVLGLTVVASIVGAEVRKGLLSVVAGLLVAAMASDPNLGKPRCNFGFLELYDSIPFTPLIMGMFAFPALMELIADMHNPAAAKFAKVGNNIMKGVIYCIRKPFLSIWSALIGLFVGIIPGAGVDVGAFMAYGQAKMLSKSPETFGKGNPEGVLAAEGANNGVAAGALVPAMALGIPGGTTTAVMISALTLHGVTIGPQIIRNFPAEVYALMLSALVCAILTYPMGIAFNKMAVRILSVNRAYLIPAVFILCMAGSYADRKFIFDNYLCFVAGLGGIAMAKGGYPAAPFILAFILEPILEQNFIRATLISQGDLGIFVSSTISVVLWVGIVVTLFLPVLLKFYRKLTHK